MSGIGDFSPKHPVGHTPGKEFVSNDYTSLRVGIIVRVDEINLKADVKLVTGGGDRYEIDLTQPLTGPRSFWGGVPEVGSLCHIGFRRKHKQIFEAVILGYIPVGNKIGLRFDPYAPDDPSTITDEERSLYEKYLGKTKRYKRLRLAPGDVGGMSSSGAELALSKDVRMVNRAGDLIELRDLERTLVMQSVHRFDSACGVKTSSGPARRGAFFLPPDIFEDDGVTLKSEAQRYFGRDELQRLGPGPSGADTRYADSAGKINPLFNNQSGEYPSVTYNNGRRVFYPSTLYAESIEGDELTTGNAFVEHRVELSHDTDLVQEVLDEIDGFSTSRRRPYIESVTGTVVGNDPTTGQGMRQYGKVLRPQLWTSFLSTSAGKFTLTECDRAGTGDVDSRTLAGAYLFRIYDPTGKQENNPFTLAIQKQGKLLLSVPKPTVERYPDARGVSAEVNLQGALKMFIGAAQPMNTSLHLTMEGGIKADIGRNSDTGAAIDVTYHCAVRQTYVGVPDDDGVASSQNIRGHAEFSTTGDSTETIEGSKSITANGNLALQGDRTNVNAISGFSLNTGEMALMVSGKTQQRYAQLFQETVVTGGKVSTILAGGYSQTVAAGATSFTTAAGATTFNNPGGAFNVVVGTGGIVMTAASGAVSVTAGVGAVALTSGAAMTLTAGLSLNLTATAAIIATAPQVLIGGPGATLGVLRGLPSLPPGTPTLCYITGTPLQGSATFRSLL
jgi:hypothetical protein